jgi:nitrogen PTS system EIIA component
MMQIDEILAEADVLLDVQATDKSRLLRTLAEEAAASLGLSADTVLKAINKREALGSTGICKGVAIPHAPVPGLTRRHGVLARLATPIAFDAVDDLPVDIVFLVLLPETKQTEQLNALACVARKLRDPGAVANLRHARTSGDLYRAAVA